MRAVQRKEKRSVLSSANIFLFQRPNNEWNKHTQLNQLFHFYWVREHSKWKDDTQSHILDESSNLLFYFYRVREHSKCTDDTQAFVLYITAAYLCIQWWWEGVTMSHRHWLWRHWWCTHNQRLNRREFRWRYVGRTSMALHCQRQMYTSPQLRHKLQGLRIRTTSQWLNCWWFGR